MASPTKPATIGVVQRILPEADGDPIAIAAPTPTLTRASKAAACGEPTSGISRNGTRKLPAIDPTVLIARNVPVLRPDRVGSSASIAEAAGKLRPRMIVVIRTTSTADPKRDERTLAGSLVIDDVRTGDHRDEAEDDERARRGPVRPRAAGPDR